MLEYYSVKDGVPIKPGNYIIADTLDNTEKWYQNGVLHRENGAASIDFDDGIYEWYHLGKLHRFKGPAIINYSQGSKSWYQYGKLHRKNEPAYITSYCKVWYWKGVIHRKNGPAILGRNYECGNWCMKSWYQNGVLHRKNGPAVEENNGVKEWWVNGKLHREDGPAVEISNLKFWLLNDVEYTEEQYNKIMENIIKNKYKIVKKYFRIWYMRSDHPGTKIWEKKY